MKTVARLRNGGASKTGVVLADQEISGRLLSRKKSVLITIPNDVFPPKKNPWFFVTSVWKTTINHGTVFWAIYTSRRYVTKGWGLSVSLFCCGGNSGEAPVEIPMISWNYTWERSYHEPSWNGWTSLAPHHHAASFSMLEVPDITNWREQTETP